MSERITFASLTGGQNNSPGHDSVEFVQFTPVATHLLHRSIPAYWKSAGEGITMVKTTMGPTQISNNQAPCHVLWVLARNKGGGIHKIRGKEPGQGLLIEWQ
jgi:hypothetical protein